MKIVWDKNKKYTGEDFWEWKRQGYRGMELIEGIPYQYGVSVFDEEPVRFPAKTIDRILTNFYQELAICLNDMPYKIYRSHPIVIDGHTETPDIVILRDNGEIALLIDMSENDKQERLQLCDECKIPYWWIYPDSQTIMTFPVAKGNVYGGEKNAIPIADTGAVFYIENVWELPE